MLLKATSLTCKSGSLWKQSTIVTALGCPPRVDGKILFLRIQQTLAAGEVMLDLNCKLPPADWCMRARRHCVSCWAWGRHEGLTLLRILPPPTPAVRQAVPTATRVAGPLWRGPASFCGDWREAYSTRGDHAGYSSPGQKPMAGEVTSPDGSLLCYFARLVSYPTASKCACL